MGVGAGVTGVGAGAGVGALAVGAGGAATGVGLEEAPLLDARILIAIGSALRGWETQTRPTTTSNWSPAIARLRRICL